MARRDHPAHVTPPGKNYHVQFSHASSALEKFCFEQTLDLFNLAWANPREAPYSLLLLLLIHLYSFYGFNSSCASHLCVAPAAPLVSGHGGPLWAFTRTAVIPREVGDTSTPQHHDTTKRWVGGASFYRYCRIICYPIKSRSILDLNPHSYM